MVKNNLAIIVLNWNGADDALECIDSLRKQTLKPTIIVVDNNSSDDSVARFKDYKKSHPKTNLVIIENTKNLGFAGGINTGLRYAISHKFDLIGVLNPDAVADIRWCKSLVDELLTYDDCGIVTGLLLRRDGKTIDSSGDFYTTWGLPGPRNRDEPIDNAPHEAGDVFGATGGGAMYRATIFNDVDMFDEDFFMYYEDVDLSFRTQLAGWRIRFTPNAIAYHKVGASSGKVPGLAVYNTFKNLPLVFIKNVPGKLFWSVGIRFFITYWVTLLSAVRYGNGWPAFKGAMASLRKKPAAYRKRWHIQKKRRVSINYISSILHQGPLPNQTGLLKLRKLFTGR